MKRIPLLLLIPLILIPACSEEKKGSPEKGKGVGQTDSGKQKPDAFQKLTYEKALAKAKEEKKVVMVDFNATWCGPCKMLDKNTFPDQEVNKMLTSKTVAIKVDVDEDPKLAQKYKITGIPCLVFINGDGKEVGRLEGFMEPGDFLDQSAKFVK